MVRSWLMVLVCLGLFSAMICQPVIAETAPDNAKFYNIPAGALGQALSTFAGKAGVTLSFDPALTQNKSSPPINGTYDLNGGFKAILLGSGLTAISDGHGGYYLEKLPAIKGDSNLPLDIKLEDVAVRAKRLTDIGPLPGLSLTKEEIPGNVQSITAKQIKDAHSVSLSDLMNSQLQSVNVNDYQGNPFQMDVTYRGFTASPQLGTPQGLSVFLDGIRVNEPFGSVVNWDMIPMNALAGMDVFPGSNPIFGLGTLGGALSMKTKNGFDNPGAEAEMLTGAFGRKQFQLSAGGNSGDFAGFVALNLFGEDGWRQNSPTNVNQIFSKLSYRNDSLSLDGSMLYAWNDLVGNGTVPIEMYNQNNTSVYSSPDETKNKLMQFQIASAFQVSDTFSITGQVYNRNSDRKSSTGDVNTDLADYGGYATQRLTAADNSVCAYASTNTYRIPNYYVVSSDAIVNGNPINIFDLLNGVYNSAADAVAQGFIDGSTLNQALPADYAAHATAVEANMFNGKLGADPGNSYVSNDGLQQYVQPGQGQWLDMVGNLNYYTDSNGVTKYIIPADPINGNSCGNSPANTTQIGHSYAVQDANGNLIKRNGAADPNFVGGSTGYIAGTPTAVITDTTIHQLSQGGAAQLNWNTDLHKFMVGASLDHSTDTYTSAQMLGLFDANRRAYLDAAAIGEEFTAASVPITNNNFNGSDDTRSLYFSETYSPKENLHFAFATRYNSTKVMTNMNARLRSSSRDLMDYQSYYMDYLLCTGLGLDSCDTYLLSNPLPDTRVDDATSYKKENFSYRSINPSLGATWSIQNNLNVYGNWSQGARTPTAIELGCAFDRTIVTTRYDGVKIDPTYASLVNGSSCNLPNSLSGDPYLKQVISQTTEFGVRGKLANGWDWNASIYQTNLRNDIYYVGYTATQSFFDNVGDTRRRGIEMGLAGKEGKFDFKLNYSLTDATFQSTTQIANSTNITTPYDPTVIGNNLETIHPGDRMPGIPLNNLNANFGYQITEKWHASLTAIAHGSAYERGNENNQQHPGTIAIPSTDGLGHPITLYKTFTSNGKTPGYMVLNFNTSYDFGHGWSGTLIVNNLLDKFYYSAGRLGTDVFTPSINGAIGPGGFNYNSNEWLQSNFISPGAPRAAWISVRYDFDADKK